MTEKDTLSDDEVVEAFLALWGRRQPVFDSHFLGIRTLQNPMDAWILQEIIFEVKPDYVVEAGNYHGGSSVLWAMLLEQINPAGRVISVDIEDRREDAARDLPIARERVEFIQGSSIDPAIVSQVHERVAGGSCVVILDSNHAYEHVKAEIDAYAPLVPEGSYLIVQDTLAGPVYAVHEFIDANPAFEIDRSRERFMITNTLDGYLRHIPREEREQPGFQRAPTRR